MRTVCATLALLVISISSSGAQKLDRGGMNGSQLYRAACAACHGLDGKGQPLAVRGFEIEPPDFTDCKLATPEADLDWMSVIHGGGPARAFNRIMPAFGDELSIEEIEKIVGHLRSFCTEPGWPAGDLNLPRAFVTEKAFPENEAVLTTEIASGHEPSVTNDFLYEHRVGRRGQYEISVPLQILRTSSHSWNAGLGDVAVAYKHVLADSRRRGSILAAGGEITFPTGSESKGLGGGVTLFEAFGAFSQALPGDGFLHVHGGFEAPSDSAKAAKETFVRVAVGKTYMQGRWGRAWSPMLEILTAKELDGEADAEVDVLPQIQVSLSTRQHVLVNAGVRIPLTQRDSRQTSVLLYLLWDWFDGSLVSGW